ncbi:MAG: hypothetical protein J7M16_14245 [Anaerolineae bacterium]|nr:hypothetical protein [Anaerolineae bacterium]
MAERDADTAATEVAPDGSGPGDHLRGRPTTRASGWAKLLLLAIEIASRGLAAERPPAWTHLSTQVDSQL